MINLYAYTYPSAKKKFKGYVLAKVGDSIRDVEVRMNEQGRAAEYEQKVTIGAWNNLQVIKRDYQLHRILTKEGLHHTDGAGTEWFKLPGKSIKDAFDYIDALVEKFEGKKIRNKVVLRQLQQKALNEAMSIIDRAVANGQNIVTIIANLCPRFGKTIWGLMLFNEIFKKYNNRVMLLPAYWLSVHSSFINELDRFDDFLDIAFIDPDQADAEFAYNQAIENDQRVIIPISLHGNLEDWCEKHQWIANIDNSEKISFADEGDFGTHADNQVEKLNFLLGGDSHKGVMVKIFASGTNVQRLAKGSGRADGVIYTAYSQLEKTEKDLVKRKFYMLEVDSLKQDVEQFDETVQPSFLKIWGKPNGNKSFISKLFLSLVGDEALRQEINLSNITGESIDCFMLLTSANKKEMKQIKEIAERALPDWHIKILNGDYTTNKQAEYETTKEINEARIAGKAGVIIISNQMGSRSYSISEIQACVLAYDRGSIDATNQKASRCLTPGTTYKGEVKEYGHILDLSFDPNRNENIERLLIDEIIMVQKSEGLDFPDAITFVLSSLDCFSVRYGTAVKVDEETLFGILGDNDHLLRVADVTVDVESALDLIEELANVKTGNSNDKDKKAAIDKAKNKITEGSNDQNDDEDDDTSDEDKKAWEKIINDAVRSLNMSATSVFNLAGDGNSYRECIDIISTDQEETEEFEELFGVGPNVVQTILDRKLLNEPVLDVIVQNTKNTIDSPFV